MNFVAISGRLGKDPEIRYTQNQKAFTFFSLAVRRGEQTDWFDVQAWDKLAENMSKSLKKGSPVAVSGRLETSQDKEGKTRVKIVANDAVWFKEEKTESRPKPAPKPVQKSMDFLPDDEDDGLLPF